MLRKIILALTFVASLAAFDLMTSRSAQAEIGGRRPVWGTYYYHNGPTKAFLGPPIRVHSNAYDIGPYGPGYGWPFWRPAGTRFYVGF